MEAPIAHSTNASHSICYRQMLSKEYLARVERNPSYTLRAFARDLALSPSTLSEVLGHKQGMSVATALKVVKRVSWDESQKTYFCDLVQGSTTRNSLGRKQAIERGKAFEKKREFSEVELDTFKLISEWYHLAIVELCFLKGFELTPDSASRALGIPEAVAKGAIERLVRRGLLQIRNASFVPSADKRKVEGRVSSQALKSFHRENLQKAISATNTQEIPERVLRTGYIPVRADRVEYVRKRVLDFCSELITELSADADLDSLYCLGVQYFRIDKFKENRQ